MLQRLCPSGRSKGELSPCLFQCLKATCTPWLVPASSLFKASSGASSNLSLTAMQLPSLPLLWPWPSCFPPSFPCSEVFGPSVGTSQLCSQRVPVPVTECRFLCPIFCVFGAIMLASWGYDYMALACDKWSFPSFSSYWLAYWLARISEYPEARCVSQNLKVTIFFMRERKASEKKKCQMEPTRE